MQDSGESYVSETLNALVVMIIVTVVGGAYVLRASGNEVAYVSAQALQPMKPSFGKSVIVYRPLTPNERVADEHNLLLSESDSLLAISYAAAITK